MNCENVNAKIDAPKKVSNKRETLLIATAAIGVLLLGGRMLYNLLPKIPIKEYTAACFYLAVMDDEIARNELEGNSIDGKEIVFPSKRESLQSKYHLFLEMHKKLSATEMDAEIRKFEIRLKESKQHIGQEKQKLKSEWSK